MVGEMVYVRSLGGGPRRVGASFEFTRADIVEAYAGGRTAVSALVERIIAHFTEISAQQQQSIERQEQRIATLEQELRELKKDSHDSGKPPSQDSSAIPHGPDLILTDLRLARATPPSGLPVLLLFPCACVPPPLPRRNRPVHVSLASRSVATFAVIRAARLPRYPFRGLLSVHSRCDARTLAKPPLAARSIEVLQTMSLPPSSAPIATGWSDSCRTGLPPAGE